MSETGNNTGDANDYSLAVVAFHDTGLEQEQTGRETL